MEGEMSNEQTQIARVEKSAEQAFISGGERIGSVFGRPKDSKEKPTDVPLSEVHIETLTQLQLPERIIEILKGPLEKLQLALESNKAMHNQLNKMINYHELQTPKRKIVFTYFSKELLDEVEDVWLFKTFSNLGFIFNKKFEFLFIITDAEKVENDFQEMIKDWQNNLSYEKIELLLNGNINPLEEADLDVRLARIQTMFDLSQDDRTTNNDPEAAVSARADFRLKITNRFSLNDIKTLCHDLGVNYDNLGGDTIETKVIELIDHFENRGTLQALIEHCKRLRPEEDWAGA
jgi:hypothetical protein